MSLCESIDLNCSKNALEDDS